MKNLLANWKTTLGSLVALAALVCSFTGWLTPHQINALTAAAAAFGLAVAKDGNVTGGSVGQPSTPQALQEANQAPATGWNAPIDPLLKKLNNN